MKLTNINEVNDFLNKVNECKGEVILKSVYGDIYNLSSSLSRYVAMGALLGDHGEELELFCTNKEDEHLFLKFFNEHPETL